MKLKLRLPNFWAAFFGLFIFGLVFRNTLILEKISFLSTLQFYGRLATILMLVLWICVGKRSCSKSTIMVSAIYFWNAISTVINRGGIMTAVGNISSFYLICLAMEVMKNRKNLISLLRTWMGVIFLLTVVDVLTQIAYPMGMYETDIYANYNWFLGYKMERVVYTFPMVIIAIFISLIETGKINRLCYGIMTVATVNVCLSKTTMGAIAFILVFILVILMDLASRGKFKKAERFYAVLLDYRLVMAVYLVVLVVLVFEQSTNLLKDALDFLGKSSNASGRTVIWMNCIEAISDNWLTGKGYLSSAEYVRLTRVKGGTNAHNMILTILMNGGIVSLAVYLWMTFSAVRKANAKSNIGRILLIMIYAFFLMGISSSMMVYSAFGALGIWLMEYVKKTSRFSTHVERRKINAR